MGRGRAKAKQTKVARELKYSSHAPDYDRLQQELSGPSTTSSPHSSTDDRDDSDDEYARWESSSG
ncbi:MAG TPA: DUF3073 domain-containing protein [Mycobacteriales bacterium]|jgi:hypothetical protein